MRILYIAPKNPIPADEGGKIAILGNLVHLNNRGHQIDFVCYSNANNNTKSDLNKITNSIIEVNYNTKNSILGVVKNLFSLVPYNVWKYHSRKMEKVILEKLHKTQYDIVFIENLHLGFLVESIKRNFSVPVILRQHNLEMKIMKRYYESESNFILKRFAKIQYNKFLRYEPQICAKFDKVIMITEKDEEEILKLNSAIKATVIPAGVEKKSLEFPISEKERFSLFHIGRLDWFPNIDALKYFINEILPELIKKESKIKFYIYGGKLPDDFIIPGNIKSHIIQKGFVKDLWSEIADKELAVVPLRIGSGMRLKIIELLAAGHNIISTSIGSEGISVENGKHLLIADGNENLVNTVIDFFEGKFDNKLMIENGRKLIEENYVWEKITEKFEKTFLKLVN